VKVLKVTAVLLLSIPMTFAIGVAFLFGSLIRKIIAEGQSCEQR